MSQKRPLGEPGFTTRTKEVILSPMPRGARKGERRGGRVAGTPNKATVEKQRVAAEIAARTIMDAKAKEQMQEFLPVLANYCAFFQPTYPGMPVQNANSNPAEFFKWFDLFITTARTLAPYESATFRAIDMRASLPANQGADPMEVMKSLLDEIDDDARRERAERAKLVEVLPPPADRKRA